MSRLKSSRDSGFSRRIGTIPRNLGQLDTGSARVLGTSEGTLPRKKNRNLRSSNYWKCIQIVIPSATGLTHNFCQTSGGVYACPVFHNALPAYLSAELEKLQKRAMRIIFPFMPYKVALATAGLPSMYERRETITAKLFNDVISNPDHKLHSLLPTRNQSKYSLRNNRAPSPRSQNK